MVVPDDATRTMLYEHGYAGGGYSRIRHPLSCAPHPALTSLPAMHTRFLALRGSWVAQLETASTASAP
jgi:hypothetical protein